MFWWKYCPGNIRLADYQMVFSHPVSILVLVEVLPWGQRRLRDLCIVVLFQSLFWWKYCPGTARWMQSTGSLTGFNPCSGGSIALGNPLSFLLSYFLLFQSLFWWKYCPGLDRADGGWWEVMFQSLFWWKYCPGFFPCRAHPDSARFQSLFWWKYCPGSIDEVETASAVRCFNPCSGGSIALGTWRAYLPLQIEVRFQSLFWWKYCPGGTAPVSPAVGWSRFNPCSGGSIALGPFYVYRLKLQRFIQIACGSKSRFDHPFFLRKADIMLLLCRIECSQHLDFQ